MFENRRDEQRNSDGVVVSYRQWPDTIDGNVEEFDGSTTSVRPLTDAEREEWTTELAAEADQAEREQVRNFVGNLDAYLALSPPSNAQVVAQVDRLTRAVRRLIVDQYGN